MSTFPVFDSTRIFPAIDLRRGRCVRLVRGRRDAEIRYDEDPIAVARTFRDHGAECLHVIDLGAVFGEPESTDTILEIASAVDLPLQVGGGIRSPEKIAQLLGGGVGRVILGTRAFRDPAFLVQAIEQHGTDGVVVALDCEGEQVRVAGWEEDSALDVRRGLDLAGECGAVHLLVTATDRDGTLAGPRLELYERLLAEAEFRIVAAGGIGTIDHVRELVALCHPRLEGVVVGRALYEGTVDLQEAIALTGAAEKGSKGD